MQSCRQSGGRQQDHQRWERGASDAIQSPGVGWSVANFLLEIEILESGVFKNLSLKVSQLLLTGLHYLWIHVSDTELHGREHLAEQNDLHNGRQWKCGQKKEV